MNIPEELIKVAESFSKEYEIIPAGEYAIAGLDYKIQYVDEFESASLNNRAGFHCRVGTDLKPYKIQLNRKRLLSANVTPDYIYSLIIWGYIRRENLCEDFFFCDKEALLHCISLGKNKKNILQGWNTIFIEVPTEQNVSRMTRLLEQVKAIGNGETKRA
jgi:hypothetical protein